MIVKVWNALAFLGAPLYLAIAIGPAIFFAASSGFSAAGLGVGIAWFWVILFTKPPAWWQKW